MKTSTIIIYPVAPFVVGWKPLVTKLDEPLVLVNYLKHLSFILLEKWCYFSKKRVVLMKLQLSTRDMFRYNHLSCGLVPVRYRKFGQEGGKA